MKFRFKLDNKRSSYSTEEDYTEYLEELDPYPEISIGKWTLKEIWNSKPQLFPAYGWLEAYTQGDIAQMQFLDNNVTLEVKIIKL